MKRRMWTMLALAGAMGATTALGCEGKAVKDPESCKAEGKESGEKCKICCEAAAKAGHRWMTGDCKCI